MNFFKKKDQNQINRLIRDLICDSNNCDNGLLKFKPNLHGNTIIIIFILD